MFAAATTTFLFYVIVGVSATDDGWIVPIPYKTFPYSKSCLLTVLSSGSSPYGESFNGDVYFQKGSKTLLVVGLHPEHNHGSLAIFNPYFSLGTRKWNMQWVDTKFPDPSEKNQREYTFEFRDIGLIVLGQGKLLIVIPYDQLTRNKDQFLSDIDAVRFVAKDIDIKFATKCSGPGSSISIPIVILYDNANQQGSSVTIQAPEPNFGLNLRNFNDKTGSIWAVIGDWELYTDSFYYGERFLVKEGQKMNAKRSDSYSSARPANCHYIADPTTAKLRVSASSHLQGEMQEFLTPQKNLGDWKNMITSVIADKGDWELYTGESFSGDKLLLNEGQQKETLGKFDNAIVSLRPVCETYKGKEKCKLNSVEILDKDQDLQPMYTGTEVIGSQSSGSCYGPATHEIEITQINGVEESFSLEVSREDEVNWDVTASVKVETSAKFFGSGVSVEMGVTAGGGGATIHGNAETTETRKKSEKEHGQTTIFEVPGAGILFGIVDRYEIDKQAVAVQMHMTCPDGRNKTVDSTMAMKQVTFGAAHFWSLTGQFSKDACKANRELPVCVENVRKNFANFVGQRSEIEDAFEKCFADGKGTFKRV